MKNLKYYFQKAQKEGFAVGQFNFSDFTQMKAIVSAAQKNKSPIILGTSENESKFFGLEEAVALRDALRKKYKVPLFLNLDHGKSFEYIKQAVIAGYDMVHFDGSKLPLAENIKISKQVVTYAGKKGILVEGEVGRIGTDASRVYMEEFVIKEEDLTKPEEAKEFLKKTGVDLLAVSVGNFHGIEISGIDPNLRLDVLASIKKETGRTFLTLHGGSGTDSEDIKKAIRLGIVKININTELRLAFTGRLRKSLETDKDEIVPYKYLGSSFDGVEITVAGKINLFGSQNKV